MTALAIVTVPLVLALAALVVAWWRQRNVSYTVVFGEPPDDPYELGLRSWDHDCCEDDHTSEDTTHA